MKSYPFQIPRRPVAVGLSLLALLAPGLQAAPFLYSSGDLVLSFRQSGNASDYVVNLGPASLYSALGTNSTLTITNLLPAQLTAAFPSLNGVSWSVGGAIRNAASLPLQTLWATAPRPSAGTQSSPWLRKGQYVQGNAASQIEAIGNHAAASSSSQPSGPNNSVTGVVIPVSTDYAVTPLLGESGNYANTFQGSVESITSTDFDASAQNASWADLYELLPGSSADASLNTPGRYLGYFELKPDGSLAFSNTSPLPTGPTIESIQLAGTVATLTFATVNQVTYAIRSNDAAGLTAPLSTWNSGPTVVGTGSTVSLQVTNTASAQFFVIEARP